jgi:hypothetical protein
MPLFVSYFSGLTYNCERSSYDLTPLPSSIIKAGKVFACNKQMIPVDNHNGTLAVVLELDTELDEKTYYKSIERLKNLICLAYGTMPQEQRLEYTDGSLDDIVDANLSEHFYNPDIRYGSQLTWDLPMRIAAYSQHIAKMPEKAQNKFWQALQTYCYARQITHLPNPQYKYTLYMSLHLASIDQLAENPKNLHDKTTKLSCPICGELNVAHNTSHVDEIEKMMRSLIEADRVGVWVTLMKKLYHPVRSNFVHDGNFAGLEDIGGFIAFWENNTELSENDINLMILNKMLLEKYLQANQPETTIASN